VNRSKRDRMHPGLARHFPGDGLFDRVARALCEARCVPRRELFESWEFVQRVRRHLDSTEVWDLCAGHGLVSMVLALLEPELVRIRAIDRRKPASFEKARAALSAVDPARIAKVEFVEAALEDLAPPAERVFMVAVHACGRRTDRAIELAIASRSSVALLPCCHDASDVEMPHAVRTRWSKRDGVDLARIFALDRAGYRTLSRRIADDVTSCADAILGIAP
jgi:hypothetical protein